MICPFCNEETGLNGSLSINGLGHIKEDHHFKFNVYGWYILLQPYNLFINRNYLAINSIKKDILKFEEEITPEEAATILKKYLKLKAFI